ncbi:MAG: type I restriction-modification enzyme R subunit C-terminal domain-containing protein [Synergistales bacterium]|nr:type I restriction-modification enzyme R subunit C-terminal domain-containing protein [Synergistales bacterium]
MKGRACRYIEDEKLREVTPNADSKEFFYIVDAVGVTEHAKSSNTRVLTAGNKIQPLEILLEHLAHNELSDENLSLLRDYCAGINSRYEKDSLFGRHLDEFIRDFGFSPRDIAVKIQKALDNLPPYLGPSNDNSARMSLINDLISNVSARKKLLELKHGYRVETNDDPDSLIYSGFSKEEAGSFIKNFESYLEENKDRIEALRIIYNSEDKIITHDMLIELRDALLAENPSYNAPRIWKSYSVLDENVKEPSVNVLTNLIQIVRFAYKKSSKLISLVSSFASRFNLYCGQTQRQLTEAQKEIMKQVAGYIINDGAISAVELNMVNTDLWRQGVKSFNHIIFSEEIQAMSKILLKTA